MTGQDFSTTFSVDQPPDRVFAAINNVRGWWSEGIEGDAEELGDDFTLHVPGIHHSVQRVEELVPGKLVVWRVLEADLSFVDDTGEWKGTEISFELTEAGTGTEVRFNHVGLVPEFECFDVCSNAWAGYINGSLRSLITTGEGQPIEKGVEDREEAAWPDRSFTTTFAVDQTPDEVFAAINNVPGWWNEIAGTSDVLGGEFLYEVADVHRCRIRVTELVPGERVVWLVVENYFNFTQDETEWTGTEVRFEISREGGRTQLRFEHVGLIPDYECFDVCSNAWGGYINGSLRSLIQTGTGRPNENEEGLAHADEQRQHLRLVG